MTGTGTEAYSLIVSIVDDQASRRRWDTCSRHKTYPSRQVLLTSVVGRNQDGQDVHGSCQAKGGRAHGHPSSTCFIMRLGPPAQGIPAVPVTTSAHPTSSTRSHQFFFKCIATPPASPRILATWRRSSKSSNRLHPMPPPWPRKSCRPNCASWTTS